MKQFADEKYYKPLTPENDEVQLFSISNPLPSNRVAEPIFPKCILICLEWGPMTNLPCSEKWLLFRIFLLFDLCFECSILDDQERFIVPRWWTIINLVPPDKHLLLAKHQNIVHEKPIPALKKGPFLRALPVTCKNFCSVFQSWGEKNQASASIRIRTTRDAPPIMAYLFVPNEKKANWY